jgi:glycine hydroxymethyltransferase
VLLERGFSLVSGGTDNHLILIDLTNKGITGKQAQDALESVGITTNKNMVPYDTRGPFDPSGIRIGTPAVTTRGLTEEDMIPLGNAIADVIERISDERVLESARGVVARLTKEHPIYPQLGHH